MIAPEAALPHYFPTKRDLVLHGLQQEPLWRFCHDYFAKFLDLRSQDPWGFFDGYVEFQAQACLFVRPSVQAAVQLGAEAFWTTQDGCDRARPSKRPTGYCEGTMGWFVDEPWFGFRCGGGTRTRLTAVVHEEAGRWKIVHMHFSVGVPDEEVQEIQAKWGRRRTPRPARDRARGGRTGRRRAIGGAARRLGVRGGRRRPRPFGQAQRAIESYAIVPLASSGPMEKGVDLVVARRFKARGMSWLRRGASPLLHLRLLRLNGAWARYWSERFAALPRPWPSPA